MPTHTFTCIDAHTCGNPVRVITKGGPDLRGDSMAEKRIDFLERFDWMRTGLMFEPRGHDMMSGSFYYPSSREDCDVAVLFIETSGCLPMCGHGAIGTVTVMIERDLVKQKTPGVLALEVPAGRVEAHYSLKDGHVESVKIINVPSFLHSEGLEVECPGLGMLKVDVAYGGNFYAIVEPQENYRGLDELGVPNVIRYSPILRKRLNDKHTFEHPEDARIKRLSHLQWTDKPRHKEAHARNAVFYGDRAIDRSPCGTGTSARMAQLAARGELKVGDTFVNESIIGSLFRGRVESETHVGDRPAIVPSIEGWARITGDNTIYIDDRDPFAHGFQVV